MKFRLNPLVIALLATGSFPLSHAAAVTSLPENHAEVRTVVIEGDTVIESSTSELVMAQNSSGNEKKEIRVITTGRNQGTPELSHLANMPDVDVIVSRAVSEAFSGGLHMPVTKSIKNAPYSAEVISEKIQTLPDGNQISRKTSTMAYRDAAGRTRQETRDANGEVKVVHINDAVEGTRYVISPSKKTASKIGIDKDLKLRIEAIKEKAKVMAKEAKTPITLRSEKNGDTIIIKRMEDTNVDGNKELHEEIKVNVVRAGAGQQGARAGARVFAFNDGESIGHVIGDTMGQGPIGLSFQDMKWSSKPTTTQLGTKDFEGVRADGKSVTYTIPAGEIGNKNAIIVSTETWTSPDLQVVVYSKHSDPRVGDSIYRLANLKRSEQPATLFMVPDGYSVKETPGFAWSAKTK